MKDEQPPQVEAFGWQLSLLELAEACQVDQQVLVTLVHEGVIDPVGPDLRAPSSAWRFEGAALMRARKAVRLARDLGVNPAGIALVLALLDEIEQLRQASTDRT